MVSPQRLYDLDRTSTQFSVKLDKLLRDKEYVDGLRELPERELVRLVNYLHDILIHLDRAGGSSRKCLQVLREICGVRKVLPAACGLPGNVAPIRQLPDAFGGFCDVYEGMLTPTVRVCIKRLRISVDGDREKVKELFCKEAVLWKYLNHPNIVPFRGVTFEPLQLVSEWMPGGELRKYLKNNRDTDVISLSLGIAKGLIYLHSREVIHGDLKGPNIIVDELGNARIADFGLATIARGSNSLVITPDDQGYTYRWTAPEIFRPGQAASKASDVFSFGMVMIEVFTGEVPFEEDKGPAVMMRILDGNRPKRPDHPKFTDLLWEFTQRCWSEEARNRPETGEAIKVLKESNVSQVAKTLPKPPAEPPVIKTGDGGAGAIPYDVDSPELTLPPPPSSRRPLGAGSTDSFASGSTTRVVSKREHETLKKAKDARELEKLEEKRRKELEREKEEKRREALEREKKEKKQKELEREREKREAIELEKLERERRRKQLEREKEEKDARELENLKREKRRKELEREKEEEEKRQKELERERKEKAAMELEREREKRRKELEREKEEREARELEKLKKEQRQRELERKKEEEEKRQNEVERERKEKQAMELERERRRKSLEREKEEKVAKELEILKREQRQKELEREKEEKKQKELEREREKKEAMEHKERLERERGKRRRDLEREKEEREARELEKLGRQKEIEREKEEEDKRRKELGRERKEKEAMELEEKLKREIRRRELEREREEREALELVERKHRELEREKEEREARELICKKEEEEKRRKELEREKEKKAAMDLEEKLEREKRGKELEREKEEKEARGKLKGDEHGFQENEKEKAVIAHMKEREVATYMVNNIPKERYEEGHRKPAHIHLSRTGPGLDLPNSGDRTSPRKTSRRDTADVGHGSSRIDLRNNISRDRLAQYGQSRANLHDGGRTGSSRLDLTNMGDGNLSRQTSTRDTPGANPGYTTGNASRNNFGVPGKSGGDQEREGRDGSGNTRSPPIVAADTIEKKPWWKCC